MNQALSKELKRFAYFLLVLATWGGVYFSINALTAGRQANVFSGAIEAYIPYVSWFVFFYFSTYLLGIMPYFLVRDLDRFKRVVYGALIIIVVSAVVFLIYPVTHPREFAVGSGFLSSWVHLLHKVDKPFNCFPSMHVSMATIAALFCAKGSRFKQVFFGTWVLLIALSTLFIKQHYLLDILSGSLLALVVYCIVKK